jgi:hypothetical protein
MTKCSALASATASLNPRSSPEGRRGRGLRALPLLALALGVLAIAGCGSGSSTSSSPSSTSTSSEATTSTPSAPTTTQSGTGAGAAGSNQSSSGNSNGSAPTTESGGDNSIQTYGAAAGGSEKATLAAAAHSFFAAMASSDYAKVCTAIAASNREQLQAFLKSKQQKGGCPAVLKTLIPASEDPEAQKAASATISAVRIKGDTAFVLFTPKGGQPSYFVMKREGAAWKAISLAPGTPLDPTATP